MAMLHLLNLTGLAVAAVLFFMALTGEVGLTINELLNGHESQ